MSASERRPDPLRSGAWRYRGARVYRYLEPVAEQVLRFPIIRRWLRSRAHAAWRRSQQPLFLCHGNVNRSPFAAELAKARSGLRAWSAGFIPEEGVAASDRARQLAQEYGVDLSGHRSKVVTRSDLTRADEIFVFDLTNLAHVAVTAPSALKRTHLVGALLRTGRVLLADPHGRADAEMAATFTRIAAAVAAAESSRGADPK